MYDPYLAYDDYLLPASSWLGVGCVVLFDCGSLRPRPNQFENVGPCVLFIRSLDVHPALSVVSGCCAASSVADRVCRLGRLRRPKRSARWVCVGAGVPIMTTRERNRPLRGLVHIAWGDEGDLIPIPGRRPVPAWSAASPSGRGLGT